MPKRTIFTNITPLPPSVSREVAIALLHNHDEMIELNPLVIEHHVIKTPREAPADEFLDCVWHELTDKINYLPGGAVKGKITYRACFHNIPNGLQTHVYAPMGLEIREKWSVCGSLPGEPPEARELGLNIPAIGLYIREDGDMKCNIMLQSFVRKNLDKSHKVLVERILKNAERVEKHGQSSKPSTTTLDPAEFQQGSHMAQSQILRNSTSEQVQASNSPIPSAIHGDMSIHPAFRNDRSSDRSHQGSNQSLSSYQPPEKQHGFSNDLKHNLSQQTPVSQSQVCSHTAQCPSSSSQSHVSANRMPVATELPDSSHPQSYAIPKTFPVELPGSTPENNSRPHHQGHPPRNSISELSAPESCQTRPTDV